MAKKKTINTINALDAPAFEITDTKQEMNDLETLVVDVYCGKIKADIANGLNIAEGLFDDGLKIINALAKKYDMDAGIGAINKSNNGIQVDIRFSFSDEDLQAKNKETAIRQHIDKVNK